MWTRWIIAAIAVGCLAVGLSAFGQTAAAKEPVEIADLFKTHPKNRFALWIDLINRISKDRKVTIAEIGVWEGAFAVRVLKECPNVEKYYLVDPWRHLADWRKPGNVTNEKFDRIFEETMKKLDFAKDRIEVLRGTTLEVVDQIRDGELDLVYIDGDHTARGIVIDLIKLYPKVKVNGVIGGDDYVNDIFHHGRKRYDPTMVKPVVNGFVAAHSIESFFHNASQFAFFK